MPDDTFILLGDPDDGTWARMLERVLAPYGRLRVVREETAGDLIKPGHFKAVFVDASSTNEFGFLVSRIRALHPNARVIVLTASPTWDSARHAFMSGATDYILKSLDQQYLKSEVDQALKRAVLPWPAESVGGNRR